MRYYIKHLTLAALALMMISLAGCETDQAMIRGGGGPTMAQAQAEKYNGPKARLAVIKFIDKTGKAGADLGDGMSDMLTTALFNTNRFIMLERTDLNSVLNEQDFGAAGMISEKTAAALGKIEGADLLVFGAVTEFEPESIGAGGLIVGAITLGATIAINQKNKDTPIGAAAYLESHIAIDMKIVDTKTGRVVYAGSTAGDYQNWGGGIIGGIGGGSSRFPVGLGGFAGTGAEQAVRVCIEKTVEDIVRNTPYYYYRFNDNMMVTLPPVAGTILQAHEVTIPNVAPVNIKSPAARVISNAEEYRGLLADLKVVETYAPVFDWSRSRLIAVFAGEKPEPGHRIGVEKVVYGANSLDVTIKQITVPIEEEQMPGKSAKRKQTGPVWPYEIVSIDDIAMPVNFIWNNPNEVTTGSGNGGK